MTLKFSRLEDEGIRTSSLIKRFLFIFISTLAILTGITTVIYLSSARNELLLIENQELKNTSAISKLIVKSFDSSVSDVLFLGEISSRYIYEHKNEAKFLEEISSFLGNKDYYTKITIIGSDGRVLSQIVMEKKEPIRVQLNKKNFKDNPDYIKTFGIGRGHVYVSDFQLDDGVPVIIFGTPVVDNNRQKKAVLLVNYNCKPVYDIFRITFEHKTEKNPSYYIINDEGYWIKGPKREDEFGFLFSNRKEKRFDYVYPEAWKKIAIDQTGQIFTKEGLFTFTTFYPIARAEKASEQSDVEFDNTPSNQIKSFDYCWKIISFVPKNLCTIQSTTRLKEFLLYDTALVLLFIVISWIMARITLKKEYAEKILAQLSVTDVLTSLYNRRGFFLLAEQQLRIAERIEEHMALFFMDVDDFKNINDIYGHQEGDRALQTIADTLKKTFRESDILGRIGGDEFVALVIQGSPVDTDTILGRLQTNLDIVNQNNKKNYKLSVSVGVAYYQPGHKQTIDNLISVADKLMYANKRLKKKN
ncbi:MAG TPA: sensor domain-containing diguanylate cyclase [bacterium]|nr:sensor domain-containing diguanylate cyclase [bacterium]HOL34742.1 sensor domain-containing diguanylate cyclase [bacterium]HPP08313.1 sensor domain-containing diguanylate cyclase [bacterium]